MEEQRREPTGTMDNSRVQASHSAGASYARMYEQQYNWVTVLGSTSTAASYPQEDSRYSSQVPTTESNDHVGERKIFRQHRFIPNQVCDIGDQLTSDLWAKVNVSGYTPNAHLAQPPPLPPILPISLPPLLPDVRIETHPLITYFLNTSNRQNPIYWDVSLPASTARLGVAFNAAPSWQWWRQAALRPANLSSMTIRISGVERPVVIFPVEAGHPIRIADVIKAVRNVICTTAIKASTNDSFDSINGLNNGHRGLVFEDAIISGMIQRHFRGRVWWGGIRESTEEIDVWVLRLRRLRRS